MAHSRRKDTFFVGGVWNVEKDAWTEVYAPNLVLPQIHPGRVPCHFLKDRVCPHSSRRPGGEGMAAEICIRSPGLVDLCRRGR